MAEHLSGPGPEPMVVLNRPQQRMRVEQVLQSSARHSSVSLEGRSRSSEEWKKNGHPFKQSVSTTLALTSKRCDYILVSHFWSFFVTMKSMTIRNIPDPVYDILVKTARHEHRSLQEQVRYVLTHEAQLQSRSVCEEAAAYRTQLAGRPTEQSVVADVREDREQ